MGFQYVTLVDATTVTDNQKFTVELYSNSAEEAYFKEKTFTKLFDTRTDIKNPELVGTFKRVTLKVIGE